MKKKLVLGLVLLVLLVSCNPFTTNIFSGIDKMKMPDPTNVNDLLSVSSEPQFYENLASDSAEKEIVIQTLNTVANDTSADPEVRQEAALMLADVYLKTTTGTDETLSNLNSVVGDAIEGNLDSYDLNNPETLLRMLFGEPPGGVYSATYKAALVLQLNAFLGAADSLQSYGELLEAGYPVPPDTNSGDTATKALMAGIVRTIVYYENSANSIDSLAEYLATPKDSAAALSYTGLPAFSNPSEVLVDPVTSSTGLNSVIEASGLVIDDLLSNS